jgi:hypothetical protein
MLASVELKKRENRDDLDFLQMNGYVPCSMEEWPTSSETTIIYLQNDV